ncbi:AraC family transcriptional regulator [uncultured Algibacter sp.]|uniref:AraC family transcriptional regulator n=1 Tax=uncultured Algibacter sp. TaxID=298659 RepID=UPI00262C5DC6|nr:AraC family transcriptional regulator [uncultured Algibacter sp.]
MEIRFKSSECNNGELVKRFNKDFETTLLTEEEHSKFNDGITGTVKEIHINNAYILFQNYNNENLKNSILQVVQNHPVFLLQFVIDGMVSFSLNKNKKTTYKLSKNNYNLFYIPASKYSYKPINQKKQVLSIYFTEAFLISKMGACFIINSKKYQQSKKEEQIYPFFNNGLMINGQLRGLVHEFLNCSFDGVTKQSYLESKLTELVLVALASNDLKTETNKLRKDDKERLIKIEYYIQTHLKSDLSIEKLSALAGFNTSKFKNDFKQVFGMPVFQYITSLRIEKAIQLILKHDYTIAQASYEVGYKNPQHFTVAFKKKLGYLPSQLIK